VYSIAKTFGRDEGRMFAKIKLLGRHMPPPSFPKIIRKPANRVDGGEAPQRRLIPAVIRHANNFKTLGIMKRSRQSF
jgi:hypothetical protein